MIRIILSKCLYPEKIENNATKHPMRPTSETAVEKGIGSNARSGMLTTESPNPKVERISDPRNTATIISKRVE
ncbi:hypothetical protein AKA01nite_07760 [Alkalibacterium kapii]|uniref:Uncharacterized protein n=1 Tax=Alkalibacterium kapii TaxID=426704 RepID=A0A511ASH8_9LACT|nr:hypothetical protein AKA01nite_07760 [Alkalibacterium kapii]